ncbi:hypothetical protein AAHN97_09620 [Chitinophaga niabensis]|uniref:hypothetical protein n=1 Tax=Chitinophaga niabensis TaxID=536979 RepID=UPI0031B9F9D0
MMKRIFFLLVAVSLAYVPTVDGQNLTNQNPATSNGLSKDFRPPSPNAGGLGMFGQVPVGNYTGTVNVGVPLYELAYKNFKMPFALNYHGSGNRPDIFPGEVGLGWALSAGGVITRVVKGIPDFEAYLPATSEIVPIFDNPTYLANWSSTAKMNEYLDRGYFVTDDICNPDEYYFEFGGITGRFFMDHDSIYQLKSSDNQYYTIKGEIVNDKTFKMQTLAQRPDWYPPGFPYKDSLNKSKLVYKFTITDGFGVKYIFGGTNNSIEFSRPGFGMTPALPVHLMRYMASPMSWFLTAIEFPTGQKITLDYKQHTFVTKVGVNNVERSVWHRSTTPSPYYGGGFPLVRAEKSTMINACYLQTITTPKEVVSFSHSLATNQLRFPKDSTLNSITINDNRFDRYEDVGNAWSEELVPLRLDSISVRDLNGKLFRRIAFAYTENRSTRLKLLEARIMGGNYITPQLYAFEYDTLPLPPYLSNKTDHYGFYNGRNPYINTSDATYYINLDSALFTQSKDADPAYLQAEMLKKIIYPTRGYTTFEYEPHEYAAYVTTWPFAVQSNPSNANKITGGLRIKKISSYDGTGQLSMLKQYYYKKNYKANGTLSSGVLAYTPVYIENYSGPVVPPARKSSSTSYYNGTLTYHRWSSNPIFPMGFTRGNHVDYSEVTEVDANGGFTVFKYKNYDNGYNDHPPLNYVSDNTAIKQFWKEDEGTSMNLERGQLLSEELYDAAKVIKANKVYKYNDDPNRFSHHVRVINQTANSLTVTDIPSHRVVANLVYTYFPYLKEEVSTLYGTANDSIVAVLKHTYDTTYRLTKTTEIINSNGRSHKTVYRYPQDMLSSGAAVTYNKMVNRSMVNYVIERERQENLVPQETDIVEYSEGVNPPFIFPYQIQTKYMNNAAETRFRFNLYDSTDNVLMSTAGANNGLKTCYIWSYNKVHPVAVIENADYTTIESVLGGKPAIVAFSAKMPTDEEVRSFLAPLRSSPLMASAMVNTYTFDVLAGMTSMTDANNKRSYYEYDNFGRLAIVRDHDSLITKTICYNYAGNVEDCSKGRADYVAVEVFRATTAAGICTSGLPIQTYSAYSPRSELINTAGTPVLLDRKEFYWDKNFTDPLPTGFYKINTGAGHTSGGTYWYMVDGRYLYRNACGFVAPQMLKYADTTFYAMCTADLPLVPVFGTIAQGNTLYSDMGFSPKIKDGYYVYNGNYFRATNGIAGPFYSCSSLVPVHTSLMSKNILSGSLLCPRPKINTVYHSQTLGVGAKLYADIALTIPSGQGYYSNGTATFNVNSSGTITSVTPCN